MAPTPPSAAPRPRPALLLLLPALDTVDDDEEEDEPGGFGFFSRCRLTPAPPVARLPAAVGEGEGEEGCKTECVHFDCGCETARRVNWGWKRTV